MDNNINTWTTIVIDRQRYNTWTTIQTHGIKLKKQPSTRYYLDFRNKWFYFAIEVERQAIKKTRTIIKSHKLLFSILLFMDYFLNMLKERSIVESLMRMAQSGFTAHRGPVLKNSWSLSLSKRTWRRE